MNMDRFIALITTFVDLFISFKLVNAHQCGITPKDKIYRWKIPLTEPKIRCMCLGPTFQNQTVKRHKYVYGLVSLYLFLFN